MRFLPAPPRAPGPHRCRVPMFLLVVAVLTAALPVTSAGTRFLPAARSEVAPPPPGPDAQAEGPPPAAGLDTAAEPPASAGGPDGGAGAGAHAGADADADAGADAEPPASVGGPDGGAGAGAGADAGRGTFAELDGGPVWPLAGRPTVVRGWASPTGPYGPGHRGVDLTARPGAEVLAAATGRVSFAGRVAGRGVLVVELAGSGAPPLRTTYEPVRALVAEGAEVVAGRPVGALEAGPFHCAAGCLHWGLRRGDTYLDPLSLLPPSLLRRGPSRLLPVFGVPEPEGTAAPGTAALSRVRRAGSSRRRCPR
ncbi:peptidoglycan DD-metalloendopeptidase family protein [Streptomyces sp. NPDC088755]|uniref:peptidoglycan DD-metalloendopeptidase family protein n=1 Tax=Streptomyces sp. NPDC088755 TaxID=3365888 RepID=UPI00382144A3